jgi:hypothetical protein
VHGFRIEYEQTRKGYRRRGYSPAGRDEISCGTEPWLRLLSGLSSVEVPIRARNMHFYSDQAELLPKYKQALQEVR